MVAQSDAESKKVDPANDRSDPKRNNQDSAQQALHPMDNFPVRQLKFDFKAVEGHNPVWSKSNPDFAIFINALGIHVPHFERFLVKVMRQYRGALSEPKLIGDVQRIIGQEAHHAFNFVNWTQEMAKRYPNITKLDSSAKIWFEKAASSKSQRFKIGFTAGYETFTFLGGMIILNRYEELMKEADPTIRALWVWHQVEEVEHGAVAFDFYQAFYPHDEWYRRGMICYAYSHIAWETLRAFAHMVKAEGFYKQPRRAFKAWKFFVGFAWDLAIAALPVFSRKYHPRNHPICTDAQNALAVAWRQYYAEGKDPHLLSKKSVEEMMAPSSI